MWKALDRWRVVADMRRTEFRPPLVLILGANEGLAQRDSDGSIGQMHQNENTFCGAIAMKVLVDHKLCEGNGRCVEVASEVFELRDDDRSYVLVENPPLNLQSKVRLAASLCPRQAIRVIED